MLSNDFTITIPVFDRYDYFEQAINSALDQTVKCPVIVVDNASEHNKFRDFVEKLNNPLVTYHKNETNLGMVGNWNKCIDLAQTPWISILHDDDILHPRFIESLLKVRKIDPEIGLMAGKVLVGEAVPTNFYDDHKKLNPGYDIIKNTYYLYRNLSPFPGIAFRKSLVDQTGGFDQNLHPVADIYFWYRMTCITKTAVIDEVMAFYRISGSQESSSNVSKLVEANKVFKDMVLKENGMSDVLSRISVLWARQQYIDYYNKTYPHCRVKNLRYGRILNNSGFSRVMYHVRDARSFV